MVSFHINRSVNPNLDVKEHGNKLTDARSFIKKN